MNESITDNLLNNILSTLKQKGITEKECAAMANISTSYFSDWKAGRLKNPTIDKIFRISQALNVSLDDLFADGTTCHSENTYDTLLPDEHNLLCTYREMNLTGKKILQDQLKYLWAEYHQPSCKLSNFQENSCG